MESFCRVRWFVELWSTNALTNFRYAAPFTAYPCSRIPLVTPSAPRTGRRRRPWRRPLRWRRSTAAAWGDLAEAAKICPRRVCNLLGQADQLSLLRLFTGAYYRHGLMSPPQLSRPAAANETPHRSAPVDPGVHVAEARVILAHHLSPTAMRRRRLQCRVGGQRLVGAMLATAQRRALGYARVQALALTMFIDGHR